MFNRHDEYKEIFLGYSIIALQELGYSEKDMKEFLDAIGGAMAHTNEVEAADMLKSFLEGSIATRQVIFEGIIVPKEYNLVKIRAVFEQHNLMGSEYDYKGGRLFNALQRGSYTAIIYFKDLYKKTRRDIMRVKGVGDTLCDFFVSSLGKIFPQDEPGAAAALKEFFGEQSAKQVVCAGIVIPKKYNLVPIRDVFERHGFMGREHSYKGERVCNILCGRKTNRADIYFEDLYGLTEKEIQDVNGLGKALYDFFIYALKQIFLENPGDISLAA